MEPLTEELCSESRDTARALESRVEAKRIALSWKRLRPEKRRILELSIWKGLTHEEIAESTGLPLGTVKTAIRREMKRLRELHQVGQIQ